MWSLLGLAVVALAGAGVPPAPASPPDLAVLASILVVLVIDVRLIFYCLDDLNRHEIVTGGNRSFWAAVIILGGPVGQATYWLYGRGPY